MLWPENAVQAVCEYSPGGKSLVCLAVLWGENVPRISQQQLTGDSLKDHIRNSSGWAEEKQENLRWALNLVGPMTVLLLVLSVFAA